MTCATCVSAVAMMSVASVEPLCHEAREWKLVAEMSDEFDGSPLDAAKWDDWCRSFQGRMTSRKPLSECKGGFIFSPRNVSVEDAELTLTARMIDDSEKTRRNEYLCCAPYSTAIVRSRCRIAYGYFEIRAKTMKACVSNAFWLYDPHSDSPEVKFMPGDISEEIDIFELSGRPDYLGKCKDSPLFYHGALHFYHTPYLEAIVNRRQYEPGQLGSVEKSRGFVVPWSEPFCDKYHTYGFLWTPERLVWYCDGKELCARKNEFFHRPLHIVFDCEIFPSWFGTPDPKDLPAKFKIDYVRVWECPPPRNTALVPRMKIEPVGYNWFERHSLILRQAKTMKPEVVIIGDEVSQDWAGRDSLGGEFALPRWKKAFGNRLALNLGFGKDRTGNLLWRIDHGELDGLDPKLVVIQAGGNNFVTTKNYVGNQPREVAEGILAIVQKVYEKLPKAKIAVMGVFPLGESRCANDLRIQTNAILCERIAKLKHTTFVDVTSKMLSDRSVCPMSLSQGAEKLTDAGYDIWADAIRAYLP